MSGARGRDTLAMRAGEWVLYTLGRGVEIATRPFDLWWVSRVMGRLGGRVLPLLPGPRARMAENLARVYPDRPAAWRRRLMRGVCEHFVRLCVEYVHLRRYAREVRIRLEGRDRVEAMKTPGKGTIVVTAHYANWEAIRLALMAEGVECGIIYRAFNNRHADRHAMGLIHIAGRPVMQKGARGMRALHQHLAGGGVAMVLVDQRTSRAPLIPFLGHPAETVTVAALLALKTGADLVPAVARREGERGEVAVTVEPPVPHSDARTMMEAVNARISAWIEACPEQWFWLHRRWRRKGQR